MTASARSAAVLAVAMAIGAAGGLVLRAQQATFRGGRDLVRVEVTVLDKNRQPVRGLTAGDFAVLVDGKPRPVAAFATVDMPAPVAPTAVWTRSAPDVATNTAPEEGRLVVILMDRSIPPGEPTLSARRIAAAAVEQLAPNDLAAVVFSGVGKPQNFTTDRTLLLRAIAGSDPGTGTSSDAREAEDRTFVTSGSDDPAGQLALLRAQSGDCYCGLCYPETIQRIADILRNVPRRKLLLFIGTNITVESSDIDCGSRLRDAREKMFHSLDLSNLTVHSLSPTGLETASPAARASSRPLNTSRQVIAEISDNLQNESSLHILPDYTGGRVVSNTNDPLVLVPQIFAESAAYYVLGVEPAEVGKEDKTHKIEVKVNRKDMNVRFRRGYDDSASAPPTLAVNGNSAAALAGLITSVMPNRGLPLGVAVVPFVAPGKPDPVALLIVGVRQSVDTPAAAPTTAAPATPRNEHLAVLANAFDQYERAKSSDQRAFEVTFSATGVGELRYEVFSLLSLKPGRYEIRVGASDQEAAKSGSVFTYIDVPDFVKEPLSASGVLLEAMPSPISPAQTIVSDLVPIVPTARRTFEPTDIVKVFMRVYQGGAAEALPVQVTAGVMDDHDRVIQQGTTPLAVTRFAVNRTADYRLELPIASLAPGAYLLVIQAATDKHMVRREIRFRVQ